jgi:flagellar hook-basal body complex protein FliE
MDTSAIDNMLGQLRAAAAGAGQGGRSVAAPVAENDFATLLKNSLDGVNNSQLEAKRLARDFELGAPNANLSDVMISMQKANLSFQQMVQVRNRLVSAYHEVMGMQV